MLRIRFLFSVEIDDGDDSSWKTVFRYGGGMLLLSTGVTSIVLFLKQSKIIDKIQSHINGNSVVPFRADDSSRNINGDEQSVTNTRNAVNNREYNSQEARTDLTTRGNAPSTVSSGFQPYQRSFPPTSNQNSGVQPYTQPTVGYNNQRNGFNPQQQTMTIQYM